MHIRKQETLSQTRSKEKLKYNVVSHIHAHAHTHAQREEKGEREREIQREEEERFNIYFKKAIKLDKVPKQFLMSKNLVFNRCLKHIPLP